MSLKSRSRNSRVLPSAVASSSSADETTAIAGAPSGLTRSAAANSSIPTTTLLSDAKTGGTVVISVSGTLPSIKLKMLLSIIFSMPNPRAMANMTANSGTMENSVLKVRERELAAISSSCIFLTVRITVFVAL